MAVPVGPVAFGTYRIAGRAIGYGSATPFTAHTSVAPWGLVIVAIVAVQVVLLSLRNRVRRRLTTSTPSEASVAAEAPTPLPPTVPELAAVGALPAPPAAIEDVPSTASSKADDADVIDLTAPSSVDHDAVIDLTAPTSVDLVVLEAAASAPNASPRTADTGYDDADRPAAGSESVEQFLTRMSDACARLSDDFRELLGAAARSGPGSDT